MESLKAVPPATCGCGGGSGAGGGGGGGLVKRRRGNVPAEGGPMPSGDGEAASLGALSVEAPPAGLRLPADSDRASAPVSLVRATGGEARPGTGGATAPARLPALPEGSGAAVNDVAEPAKAAADADPRAGKSPPPALSPLLDDNRANPLRNAPPIV